MGKDIDKAITEARREYFRRWRKNNPDKVRKHNESFWRKKAQQLIKEDNADGVTETTTPNDDDTANS